MALEPGARLGRFEIVSLLGKGGMGEVYRARDTRLDRDVAVKVLPAELSEDETYRKRLEREARTISQLQHPNVCTLYDVGSQDDVSYLVMEYLEGETLEDRLRQGALPVDDVLRIGSEIAEAVEAAHRGGVVHRDLKPGNVMLTKTGTKVLDFGLARETASLGAVVNTQAATVPAITGEGTVVGTMPYMAPEQLQGGQADSRTDIWALGCILYEMATGDRPFSGETQASLIGAILKDDPVPPSRKQPLSPERLDHVVKRCLEKDPERRWQSARDVGIELESLQEPLPATRVRRLPRARTVALLTGALVLVALAGWRLAVGGWSTADNAAASLPGLRGLAILPFDNLTGDPDLDQLALGIGDVMTADESGDIGKRLALRNPLAEGESACDLARSLDVSFVVQGSIRRVSENLRVAAQLVQCPAESIIWRDLFDHKSTDLLAVEQSLGDSIWAAIGSVMNYGRWYANPGSSDWHIGRRTREDNAKAYAQIRDGIRRSVRDHDESREFTLNVLLWEAHNQALLEGWDESPAETVAGIEEIAGRCLELRPQAPMCLMLGGFSGIYGGRSREEGLRSWERLLEVEDSPATRGWYGWALALAGRTEEALVQIGMAMEESPDSLDMQSWLLFQAIAHFAAGEYENAREAAIQAVRLQVNSPFNTLASSYQMMAASLAHLGQIPEAREALERALELRPGITGDWVDTVYASADPEHRQRYLDGLRMAGLESIGTRSE